MIIKGIPDGASSGRRTSALKMQRVSNTAAAVLGSIALHSVLLLIVLVLWKHFPGPTETTNKVILAALVESDRSYVDESDVPAINLESSADRISEAAPPPLKPPEIRETEPVAQINAQEIAVQRPDLFDIGRLTESENAQEQEGRTFFGTERLADKSRNNFVVAGTGLGGALDDLGRGLGEQAITGEILLIWLLDSSPSMFNKIDLLKARVNTLFKSINSSRPDKMLMAVVAFDSRPQIILDRPTNKTSDVIAAFEEVKQKGKEKQVEAALVFLKTGKPAQNAGKENTMLAIQYAANLTARTDRQVVIALMTDEAGDDTVRTGSAWEALKRHKIPLYVFGPAPNFCNNKVSFKFTLQDKRLVDKSAAKSHRNPTGIVTVKTDADKGWALPSREPVAVNWGAIFPGISTDAPSGYGPYHLSKLVMLSGGKYYLIETGANYFGTKKMVQYAPIYQVRRNKHIPTGFYDRLSSYVKKWDAQAKPKAVMKSGADIVQAKRMAQINRRLAENIISSVRALGNPANLPSRWRAHRDLFLAQLYAAKYRMMEFDAALSAANRKDLARVGKKEVINNRRALIVASAIDRPVSSASMRLDNIIAAIPFPTFRPVKLVIRSEEEWKNALREHSALRSAQEKPQINFKTQMLIVVSCGQTSNPNSKAVFYGINSVQGRLEVAVEQRPICATREPDGVYFPSEVVIVPRVEGDVKFIEVDELVKSKAKILKNDFLGGIEAAEARVRAGIMLSMVIRNYSGTPWGEIAGRLKSPASYKIIVYQAPPKPPSQPPSSTPAITIPGGA